MSGETLYNVKGLKELTEAMDQLAEKVRVNVLRGALRSGAKVIQMKAKSICPIEGTPSSADYKKSHGWSPGELQRSIRVSARLKNATVSASVKAGNKAAFYAHFVEFGTAAHWINAKPGSVLAFSGTTKVYHPGARKNPFMRVAMDSQASYALDAVADYMRKRLTKEGINVPDQGDDA